MAFSDQIVNGLLRDQMGFRGYVNSDTGVINDRAWGLEDATVSERVAAAINGGTDTLSGFHDVQTIIGLVDAGLVTEERVTLAAERLLSPDVPSMGLFEDPYVDPRLATATVGSDENRDGRPRPAAQVHRAAAEQGGRRRHRPPLKDGDETVYVLGNVDAAEAAAPATRWSTATPQTGRAPRVPTRPHLGHRAEHRHRQLRNSPVAAQPGADQPERPGGCPWPRRAEPFRGVRRVRRERRRRMHRQRAGLRRVLPVGVEHPRLHRHGGRKIVGGHPVA